MGSAGRQATRNSARCVEEKNRRGSQLILAAAAVDVVSSKSESKGNMCQSMAGARREVESFCRE